MAKRVAASHALRDTGAAYFFLAPNLLLFIAFIAGPLIFSFLLSFFDWGAKELSSVEFNFVGLKNFHTLFFDPDLNRLFFQALYNTLFLMLGIPVSIAISLAAALLMNRKLPEIAVYRVSWFIPSVASGIAMLILWQWVYQGHGGLLNEILTTLFSWMGYEPIDWLKDEKWAKPAFLTMAWWTGAGGINTLLYLAALQNVPGQLYEAAEMDGAGSWARFRHITWPMVSPTTFFLLITGVIAGFQAGFAQAYILTKGGPNGATTTLDFFIFDLAYVQYRMGVACAAAWVLFLLVGTATAIQWKYYGTRVHYG